MRNHVIEILSFEDRLNTATQLSGLLVHDGTDASLNSQQKENGELVGVRRQLAFNYQQTPLTLAGFTLARVPFT